MIQGRGAANTTTGFTFRVNAHLILHVAAQYPRFFLFKCVRLSNIGLLALQL